MEKSDSNIKIIILVMESLHHTKFAYAKTKRLQAYHIVYLTNMLNKVTSSSSLTKRDSYPNERDPKNKKENNFLPY